MVRKLKNYVVKKYRENEWLQRATRTFAQAAIGTITTGLCSGKFELSEWRTWIVSIGGAAIDAGISAVMNMVKEGR